MARAVTGLLKLLIPVIALTGILAACNTTFPPEPPGYDQPAPYPYP